MQIVIDIPEDSYKATCNGYMLPPDVENVVKAIKNGTPHESVTEFADRCRECGREKVLDKVRAEIMDTGAYEQETNGLTEFLKGVNYCLNIIDKYKAESEDKELQRYAVKAITLGNCMMCGKELTDRLFFCKECEEKGGK